MSTQPSKSISIELKGNAYSVSFPTTGQMIDINVYKAKISRNQYDYLKYNTDPEMYRVSVIIDTIATFNYLAPKLTKDLNVTSVFDLEISQVAEIVEVYEKQYLPWYEEWLNFLKNPKGEENAK